MSERIPAWLERKIKCNAAYIARSGISSEAVANKYNESYGKYTEAIMDCNGTATEHYVDKEAFRLVAAMRGIEI
jgi:hypothetical protein